MKKWFAPLMSCLVLGLVAAGCGSDDKKDSGSAKTTEQPVQQPAKKAPATGGGGAVAVIMKNTQFVPMEIKVKAGGIIKWTNRDSFPHTVTKGSGPGVQFDSGTVDGGGTFKQKFDKPGTIDYVCTIHKNQTGTITVE